MQQYFGEKNLKKYDLTSSMAEKGSPTLNSRRFGVWHGKKGDTEKLFLLLLLPGGALPYITYTGMCRPKGS